MGSNLHENEELSGLLNLLDQAAEKPAKKRAVKLSSIVDQITSITNRDGVSALALERLLDLITLPNQLDQSSRGNLINNLYPIGKISDTCIFRVIGALGHGRTKLPYTTQSVLLKWLIMIHDTVENQTIFSRVYSVLFNLLDTVAIRPQICHLLSIFTQRKHVRPFRVQILMELIHKCGNEPPLIRLLQIFKYFFPDIVVDKATHGRAAIFSHPNLEWKTQLLEINYAHALMLQNASVTKENPSRIFQDRGGYETLFPKSVIPKIQTLNAQESSVTLEEIRNIRDFVKSLEIIDLPNQLVVVLGHPLLQRLLQLKSSKSELKRVDNWLFAFFEVELEKSPCNSKILEMLQLVLEYTHYSKIIPPACLLFLKSMIPSWDGIHGRDIILGLLSYIPFSPFPDLFETLLSPLESAILDDGLIDSKLTLIKFYTSLIHHWTVSLLTHAENLSNSESSISSLVGHVNNLALTTILTSHTISTISIVISFFESAASLARHASRRYSPRFIPPPPSEAIYIFTFTSSLSTLSRICTILVLYKQVLENPTLPSRANTMVPAESQISVRQCLSNFNGHLIDLCNCLWRSRAFNSEDLNAMSCLLSPLVTDSLSVYVTKKKNSYSLSSSFDLSLSPLTCLLASNYFKQQENELVNLEKGHLGPVTRELLNNLHHDKGLEISWENYKLGVLKYLVERGAPGISEFVQSTL